MEKFVTVIVPALNEEGNIEQAIAGILRSFDEFELNGECLVVNDGSTDRTADVVRSIIHRDPRVRMISRASPSGLGGSFWAGVDEARGNVLVLIPGDNETYPRDVLRYVSLMDHVDLVLTYIYNKERRLRSRKILSEIFRKTINLTFRTNFNYTNGSVIYRKSILTDLRERDRSFFFQAALLVRLVKKGYLYAECPFRIDSRLQGASKAVSIKSLSQIVKGYFRLVGSHYLRPADVGITQDSANYQRRGEV